MPIALGGDHSIVLAELRAAAQVHGPLALVLFDSHPDTWDRYFGHPYFHGTPFRRAVEEDLLDTNRSTMMGLRGALYERADWEQARALGFELIPASELHRNGSPGVPERVPAQRSDPAGLPIIQHGDTLVKRIDPSEGRQKEHCHG